MPLHALILPRLTKKRVGGHVDAPLFDGALRVSSRDLAASYLLYFKFDRQTDSVLHD